MILSEAQFTQNHHFNPSAGAWMLKEQRRQTLWKLRGLS